MLGFVVGFNVAYHEYSHGHVWPKERDGLNGLDRQMRADDSERWFLAAITSKNCYATSAISKKFAFRTLVVDKELKKVVRVCDADFGNP